MKYTPPVFSQRVLMNVMDLGGEVLFYDAVASEVPVRVPNCRVVQYDAVTAGTSWCWRTWHPGPASAT